MSMPHRIEDVVDRGMCVGCGACGVATSGAIPITLGRFGVYQASLENVSDDVRRVGGSVCPFSDESPNETTLGAPTPEGRSQPLDSRLGHVGNIFTGRRSSDDDLLESSSGGLTSWLLEKLVESGHVDGVIHVGRPRDAEAELFDYKTSNSASDVASHKKSHYYAATMKEAVQAIQGDGRSYAIVGIPCYITAARHLARTDSALAAQLKFYVGLVCGHLKSQFFAESLAWQVGVAPDDLEAVDFRLKAPGRPSYDYDFGARARGEAELRRAPTLSLFGGNWGQGAFQPEACNFCDDIFAETADVAFGDAWLPEYEDDWRGMNVVVTRNSKIDQLFDLGVAAGEILTHDLSPDRAAETQAGNFRHRRDGLAVRLSDDIAEGLSVPTKRIAPSLDHVTADRRGLIRQRRRMSKMSLRLFAAARSAGDHQIYLRPMRREFRRYKRLEKPFHRRLGGRLKRMLKRG